LPAVSVVWTILGFAVDIFFGAALALGFCKFRLLEDVGGKKHARERHWPDLGEGQRATYVPRPLGSRRQTRPGGRQRPSQRLNPWRGIGNSVPRQAAR
jgi:hypothetical protein